MNSETQGIPSNKQIDLWKGTIDRELSAVSRHYGDIARGSNLVQASDYVLTGGGKRLRALLTCSVWCDLSNGHGGNHCRAIAPAVAIEVLHAASLVHDDLPALDNDDIRRGRPACHKAYGEASAILTGDALVGAAILHVMRDATLASDEHARLSSILMRAWVELCAGQQLDIDLQKNSHEATMVEKRAGQDRASMIRLKTGALFGAAVECGALCAGVRDSALETFREWGVKVGECFQAIDDLDDGDRPASDGDEIRRECLKVQADAQTLDPRLTAGITATVVDTILLMSAQEQT